MLSIYISLCLFALVQIINEPSFQGIQKSKTKDLVPIKYTVSYIIYADVIVQYIYDQYKLFAHWNFRISIRWNENKNRYDICWKLQYFRIDFLAICYYSSSVFVSSSIRVSLSQIVH